MDLNFTSEDEAFRQEVRAFAHERVPLAIREKVRRGQHLEKSDYVTYQKLLDERGWATPAWPVEWGGKDWSPVRHIILDEELALAGAPRKVAFGFSMVGPVIIAFGSEAQKQRHLPPIRSSDVWWCQGFSEPGSGSDLASLRTRAVREGNHYVVNGQKTWTTYAHHADWIFCLVRTDTAVKPQAGISFLLFDMRSPGVTVRPIYTLDGSHVVNEVFFDDVRVPVENLVGEENKGWTYAKYLLSHERSGIAGVGMCKYWLGHLKAVAARERSRGRPLLDDPVFRAKIAEAEMDLMTLDLMNLRIVGGSDGGKVDLGRAAMLKIRGSEMQQRISTLIMEAVGPAAAVYQEGVLSGVANEEPIGSEYAALAAPTYLNNRKVSIYGGTNEIQKGIIAKAMLGL